MRFRDRQCGDNVLLPDSAIAEAGIVQPKAADYCTLSQSIPARPGPAADQPALEDDEKSLSLRHKTRHWGSLEPPEICEPTADATDRLDRMQYGTFRPIFRSFST